MTKFAALFTLLAAIIMCGFFAASAQAQRARVFVASYGSDSNPCTFGSPCKTFQHAHDAVAAGGEITAIDSAGFGPVIITKAITITSPDGVEAGIAVPSGQTGVTINANGNDVITLRGLTINGANVGDTGVLFSVGSTLIVKNCIIRNFQTDGIHVTAPKLVIADTLISNADSYGIEFAPTTEARLVFEHLEVINASSGIRISGENLVGQLFATGSESLSTGSQIGIEIVGGTSTTAVVLDSVRVSDNSYGLAVTSATVYLSRTTISGNDTGIAGSATFKSYGNNQLVDTYNTATLSPIAPN